MRTHASLVLSPFSVDLTKEARAFALAVYETGERFGMNIPIAVLKGSASKAVSEKQRLFRVKTPRFALSACTCPLAANLLLGHLPVACSDMKSRGALSSKSEKYLKTLAPLFVSAQVLQPYTTMNNFTLVRVGAVGHTLLRDAHASLPPFQITAELKAELAVAERKHHGSGGGGGGAATGTSITLTTPSNFSPVQRQLLVVLEEVRSALGKARDVPAYTIVGRNVLNEMTAYRPTTPEALLQIKGVGAHQATTFGPSFLKAIADFVAEHSELDTNLTPPYVLAPGVSVVEDSSTAAASSASAASSAFVPSEAKAKLIMYEPIFASAAAASGLPSASAFFSSAAQSSSAAAKPPVRSNSASSVSSMSQADEVQLTPPSRSGSAPTLKYWERSAALAEIEKEKERAAPVPGTEQWLDTHRPMSEIKHQCWELFSAGKTVAQIVTARTLRAVTIVQHLADCIAHG
jgi:hypothetical protein